MCVCDIYHHCKSVNFIPWTKAITQKWWLSIIFFNATQKYILTLIAIKLLVTSLRSAKEWHTGLGFILGGQNIQFAGFKIKSISVKFVAICVHFTFQKTFLESFILKNFKTHLDHRPAAVTLIYDLRARRRALT